MLVVVNSTNGGWGSTTWVGDSKGVCQALPIDGHCPDCGCHGGGWVAIADLGDRGGGSAGASNGEGREV